MYVESDYICVQLQLILCFRTCGRICVPGEQLRVMQGRELGFGVRHERLDATTQPEGMDCVECISPGIAPGNISCSQLHKPLADIGDRSCNIVYKGLLSKGCYQRAVSKGLLAMGY